LERRSVRGGGSEVIRELVLYTPGCRVSHVRTLNEKRELSHERGRKRRERQASGCQTERKAWSRKAPVLPCQFQGDNHRRKRDIKEKGEKMIHQ